MPISPGAQKFDWAHCSSESVRLCRSALCWPPFGWRRMYSILQCGDNPWSNFGRCSFFDQHVSAVVRSCFFHVRSLSKVRSYLAREAASSTSVSLILSKLGYCNSLRAGLLPTQIKLLQAFQNAAARTGTKCEKTDHITPILRQLHWLPVHDDTHHKLLSATYLSVHRNAPLYLSELPHFYAPSLPLRLALRSPLDVPRPRNSRRKR